jgi:hypothetical protein
MDADIGRLDADTEVVLRLPPTVVGLSAGWAGKVLRAALVGFRV